MASKGMNAGQMRGEGGKEKFADPCEVVSAPLTGFSGTSNLGEKSGFVTSGYLDKKGTPYGEAAKFNLMPPGMEIDNQDNAHINEMPMKKLVGTSFPGDGWSS